VGESGVERIVARTADLMKSDPNEDVRAGGGLDLPLIQRHLNLWFALSLDLFGGEVSSNAAAFFAAGLKGRYREEHYADHTALAESYRMPTAKEGRLVEEDVPLRNAMNEVLRDAYVEDCERAVSRWNQRLEAAGLASRLRLPSKRFHRQIGLYAGQPFDPEGGLVSREEWDERRGAWLPTEADRAYVTTLMQPVYERGRIASWIAPPARGVRGLPFDYEYVRLH
jgi:benzoyl-CoA 2,3-dioxygenase component B